MKTDTRVSQSLLAVMLLALFLVPYAAAQSLPPLADMEKPTGGTESRAPDQIGDSMVNYVFPDRIETGTPFDICFHVTVSSPDIEYMDRFDVDLPDAWTVNSVYGVPENGCGHGTMLGIEAGNVIYWQDANYPPPTGCGAWSNGSYDFCANVTIPNCTGEPWTLPWNIVGDGYGGLPHSRDGDAGPVTCNGPGLHISPSALYDVSCHAVQEYTLNLANDTGLDDTFDLDYVVYTSNASVGGPDQIYLGAGANQDLIVEITPTNSCLLSGTPIVVYAQAAGGGDLDISAIYKLIGQGCNFSGCPFVYLPLTLTQN